MSRSADDSTLGGFLRPRGPIQLTLTTRQLGESDGIVMTVTGELDVMTAPRLTAQLDDMVRRRGGDVVIDLSDAEFIDSMGLSALLNVQRRLRRQMRSLTVICGDGPVRRAIELARLIEALGVISSFAEYERRRRP